MYRDRWHLTAAAWRNSQVVSVRIVFLKELVDVHVFRVSATAGVAVGRRAVGIAYPLPVRGKKSLGSAALVLRRQDEGRLLGE